MDPGLARRLTSGEGRGLLQSLPAYDEAGAMALADRLRREGFDADLVAAALTQSRLRARAVDKLGPQAGSLLLTADGLEQATRAPVAQAHAARMAAAGVRTVLDLGCGIGSDALAFAAAGLAVHAVDADETTAVLAAANLRAHPRVRVEHARAQDVPLPAGEAARGVAVWLDPARRTPGVADITGRTRRTFRLEELSPTWEEVRGLAARVPAAGAKLSPAFPHAAQPPGTEASWTSWEGEVVECVLWWGDLADRPGRTARVLGAGVDALVTPELAAGARPAADGTGGTHEVGPFLYEPDRAVLRAGLVGALVNAVDGQELAPGVGYVAADREVNLPWARRFVVVASMPLHPKAIRSVLRDHGIGRPTVKKRGVSTDPDQLRRALRLRGERPGTLVLTRSGAAQVALLVEPVARART